MENAYGFFADVLGLNLMSTNESEKLRPCPQCLGKVAIRHPLLDYSCEECEMRLSSEYNDWRIWKLLDEKEKQIENLTDESHQLFNLLGQRQKELEEIINEKDQKSQELEKARASPTPFSPLNNHGRIPTRHKWRRGERL